MDQLPSDPFMLLSVINTRLRDEYPSLDELCAALGVDAQELAARLEAAGFIYMPDINQFR